MRSILSLTALAAATFSQVTLAVERDPTDGQSPNNISGDLSLRTPTDLGCFSSPGKMFDMGIYTYQTSGWCQPLCVRLSKGIFAMVNGTNCFCGDAPPSNQFKVDSSNCNATCSGFDQAYCGGTNYWDVQDTNFRNGDTTGTQQIVIPAQTYTYTGPQASSTTMAASTVVITQQATADAVATPSTSSSSSSSSGPNVGAIVGGVIVAVVVVFAIAGGIFFFNRRRKQRAFAEEQRRHELITGLVTREKPNSGYTSPDSRLDPSLMFQRRLSDGSIRDNQDYSRRILKVANPDD